MLSWVIMRNVFHLPRTQIQFGAKEWTARLAIGPLLLSTRSQNGPRRNGCHSLCHPDNWPVSDCVGGLRWETVHGRIVVGQQIEKAAETKQNQCRHGHVAQFDTGTEHQKYVAISNTACHMEYARHNKGNVCGRRRISWTAKGANGKVCTCCCVTMDESHDSVYIKFTRYFAEKRPK